MATREARLRAEYQQRAAAIQQSTSSNISEPEPRRNTAAYELQRMRRVINEMPIPEARALLEALKAWPMRY